MGFCVGVEVAEPTLFYLKPCKYSNYSNKPAERAVIFLLRCADLPFSGENQFTLTSLICTGVMGSSWELLQMMVCPFCPFTKK